MNKQQITNNNQYLNFKSQMVWTLNIGIWDLFVFYDLMFGISK